MNQSAVALWAVVSLFLLMAVEAQGSPPEPSLEERIRAAAERVNRPVVLRVGGEESVRVEKGWQYRSEPAARADVYRPAAVPAGTRAPIVVLLHGNLPAAMPIPPTEWGFFQSWGRLLAASGFVTVVFHHRLGYPEPRIDEAAADVEALLAHVRSRAAALEADPDRVALVAFSGGGVLLAPALRQPRPYQRCLVALYSLLETRGSSFFEPHLSPQQLELYSPVAQLAAHAASVPPVFIARAGEDQTAGLNAGMESFLGVAIAHNVPLTLMIHPRGAHGFEVVNDDARTREILRALIEFLHAQLDGAP